MRKPTNDQSRRSLRRGSGFTLVELLTVMAIISILLSVAAVGISRIERGTALTSALAISEAIFSEARATAVGEGTRTRVVIHDDGSDTVSAERYRRYLAIAVEEKDKDGEPKGTWKVSSRGTLLPAGVYFDVEASKRLSGMVESNNGSSSDTAISGFGEWETGTIDFPGLPTNRSQSCHIYEFNAEGICVHEGSSKPGAAFVLSDGNRPKGREPILDDLNKAGFVIWRSGSTSLYKNSKELQTK